MSHSAVADMAKSRELLTIATAALNDNAVPFRVAWHQDTALALKGRRQTHGWGPWFWKEGSFMPMRQLECWTRWSPSAFIWTIPMPTMAPWRVLPGTHCRGVMTDAEIHELSEQLQPVDCHAAAGAVVLMKPPVVHASSESVWPAPRRVLPIEYAASLNLENGLELAFS